MGFYKGIIQYEGNFKLKYAFRVDVCWITPTDPPRSTLSNDGNVDDKLKSPICMKLLKSLKCSWSKIFNALSNFLVARTRKYQQNLFEN